MKFLLFIFVIFAINNIFGMSCNKEFKAPEKEGTEEKPRNENVLDKDVNYGIYGTFQRGTPYETISRATKFADAKLRNY